MKTGILVIFGIIVAFVAIFSLPYTAFSITLGMSSERMLETQEIILLGEVMSVRESPVETKYTINVLEYVKMPTDFERKDTITAVGCGEAQTGGCITFQKGQDVMFILDMKDDVFEVSDLSFASPNPNCTISEIFRYHDGKYDGLSLSQGSKNNKPYYTGQPITAQYHYFNKDLQAKSVDVTIKVVDDFPEILKEETITLHLDECEPNATASMDFVIEGAGTFAISAKVKGNGGGEAISGVEVIDYIMPPLKQVQSGIHHNDVICRDDRVLVLKQSEEFASCIHPETVVKLFQRGWALPEAPIVDTNTLRQESKLIKLTGVINRLDTMEGFEYQLIPLYEELSRIAYTGYDTVNLLSTKDTVHHFIRDIDGDLVTVHGSFVLNDDGDYQRHFSGFPIILAEKVEKISENLDLEHSINGAEVISITKLQNLNAVNIVLEESQAGNITITIPREILDAKINQDVDDLFFVLIDEEEVPYTETTTDATRTLTIQFEKDSKVIKIIGAMPL